MTAPSGFTFSLPGLAAGTHSVQVKDVTTGVVSNTVNVMVNAAGSGSNAAKAITLGTVSAQTAGDSFAISGTLTGYSSAPTLTYALNGGTALSFPTAPTVSTTGFAATIPGQSAGTLSLTILDAADGVTSNAVSVAVANSGATTIATGGGTPSGTLGAVPTFRVQATNAIAVGDPLTFGHVFARGHVPSGLINALQVTSGGSAAAAVQVDQANRWPADGSLRYGSMSFYSPVAIAAGSVATFTYSAASTNLSGNALTAAGLAALCDFNLQVGGYDYTATADTPSGGTAPTSSTFPTVVTGNSSSPLTISGGGSSPLLLQQPVQGGDQIAGAYQALPSSGTWTITGVVWVDTSNTAHCNGGISLRNSSTGAIANLIVEADTNSVGFATYTNATTYGGGVSGGLSNASGSGVSVLQPLVLRLEYDGTNINGFVSQTGQAGTFIACGSATPAALGSPNQIGPYLDNFAVSGGSTGYLYVYDWESVSGVAAYNGTNGQAASTGQVTVSVVADTFTTHVNDIISNFSLWSSSTGYGTNPLGGWRYTRLGPLCTEIEAWRMIRRDRDGASHRWVKVKFWPRVWQLPGGGHHFECLPSLRQDQLYAYGHSGGTAGPNTAQAPARIAGNAVLYNGSTALAYYGGSNDPRTVTTDNTVFNVSGGTLSTTPAANTVKSWAWDMNSRYGWGATPLVVSGSGVPSGLIQNKIYYLSQALYFLTNRANSMQYDFSNAVSMGSAGSGSVTITPVAMTTASCGWYGALRDASVPWVGNSGYARPRYMVAHDSTYLFRKTRLLPPYLLNLSVPNYNDVHGTKGFSLNRPAVCGDINDYGDDPDDLRIGYMSRHQVNLALNPFDPVRELIVLSMGFGQADMQIWASDFRTGLPVNGSSDTVGLFASNPGFYMDNELRTGGVSPGAYPLAGWDFSQDFYQWSYNSLGDPSHYPWYATMPLLRTGHACFQELMEACSNELVLSGQFRSPPSYPQLTGMVDTYHNGGNIRSVGWFLRSGGCADRFTDDSCPVRPLTRYNLAQQANFISAGNIKSNISQMNTLGLPYITNNVNPLSFHLFFHYHAMQGMAMEAWVNDYNFSTGVAANFGISDAMDNNLDYYMTYVYDMMMTDASGNYYTSIANAYAGPPQYSTDPVAQTFLWHKPSSTRLWAYETNNQGANTRFLTPGSGQAGLGGAIEWDYFAGLAMVTWPDSNPIPNALRVYNHMMTRITTAPFVGYVWTGSAGPGGESDCWSQFAIAPLGS